MTDTTKGVLAIVGASTIWGLSAMYYKLLAHVPPLEVLSHRTLWSLLFFGIVLLVQGRFGQVAGHLRAPRTLGLLALSAVMISINWFGFIFSIQQGWAMEASFGYYIFPIVAVAIGFFVFREQLSRAQFLAVLLAVVAVVMLGFGLGKPPWIALMLASTFGLYGLLKKTLDVGAVASVFIEVLLLAPLALAWLLFGVENGAFGASLKDTVLLVFAGILTGGPLMLFSYAARRISMASVGLIQYLNPTLQFLVATFVFGEVFTKWHAIAFPVIWVGLAIYTLDSLRQERSSRKRAKSAGTSSTT